MNVEAIMTKNPAHVGPTASVFAALNLLNDLDVRHLPVVENGELRGIISDRDLRSLSATELDRASQAQSQFDLSEVLKQRVADLMNPYVISVDQEAEIPEAIDLMIDHKVGAIPVVNAENTLVGIISYIDILKEATELFKD